MPISFAEVLATNRTSQSALGHWFLFAARIGTSSLWLRLVGAIVFGDHEQASATTGPHGRRL